MSHRFLLGLLLPALLGAGGAAAEPIRPDPAHRRPATATAAILPSAPLYADGERVHVLKLFVADREALSPPLGITAAKGTTVSSPIATSDGALTFRYRPPRTTSPTVDTLTLSAAGRAVADVRVGLEPAGATTLTVEVLGAPLVLDRGAKAEVRVHARDAAGRPTRAPLRVGASVGKVSALKEVEPGEYRALYEPPEERFPQVAIVAALSVSDGAFASCPIKLYARISVSGEGEPGGTMQIVVDGRTFGPQSIDAQGRFSVPVIVPPGGRAVGTSVDRLGNRRTRDIDLRLPPFPRLLFATLPPELPADGRARAEIVAFLIDARGAPERRAIPSLRVDRGTLSTARARGDGSVTWTYTAPTTPGDGVATLRAGATLSRLALRPGAPREVSVVQPADPLDAGSPKERTIEVQVRDAVGSAVSGARLSATLKGGRVAGIGELGDGRYAVRVVPPRDPDRGAFLHVEVEGMVPGAPRRVSLHPVRSGHASSAALAVEAWVDDDLGQPVPRTVIDLRGPDGLKRGETDRFGVARFELEAQTAPRFQVTAELLGLPGLTAAMDYLRLGGTLIAVPSLLHEGVSDSHESAPQAAVDVELPIRPAVPIDLRLQPASATFAARSGRAAGPAPLAVTVAVHDSDGRPTRSRLLPQASSGRLEIAREEPGRVELRFVPPEGVHAGDHFVLSVTDAATRITAFCEVTAR
jgi:hypothetical protein